MGVLFLVFGVLFAIITVFVVPCHMVEICNAQIRLTKELRDSDAEISKLIKELKRVD